MEERGERVSTLKLEISDETPTCFLFDINQTMFFANLYTVFASKYTATFANINFWE